MSFQKRIEAGKEGKFKGLANGFDRMNKYVYGVQRAYYSLYGGLSGAAKTTLVDFKLLNAIRDADRQKIPLDLFYYSFEIDETTKKCNWLSNQIYTKHGKVIPPETIAGLGENRLTVEESLLVEKETPYIEALFKRIKFRFEVNNPVGIRKELMEFALTNGEFLYEEYIHNGETKKKIVSYKPYKEDHYVLIAIDHIALSQVINGLTLKENIDMLSGIFIWFRNICGYSFFVVQQFNQGLNSVDRMKFKGVDLSPQQNDFKDSTNPYTDADCVYGIMNAWKMDLQEYLGYDLTILKEKFRAIKIIKNRKGRDNLAFGLYFEPTSGTFRELPLSSDVEKMNKVYEYLKSIK